MALDATVGASTSNSYATRQEAINWMQLGMHPHAEDWAKLPDERQDAFLIAATHRIDRAPLRGVKADTGTTAGVPDQALHFPRTQDSDSGTAYIPAKIKEAVYEQALHMATSSDTRLRRQAQGVKRAKIGDVEEEYNDGQTTWREMLAPDVINMLTNYGYLQLSYKVVSY